MAEFILANMYGVEMDKVIAGEPINGIIYFCIQDEKGKRCGNITSEDLRLYSIGSARVPNYVPPLSRHRPYPFGKRKKISKKISKRRRRRTSRRTSRKRKSSLKRSRRARRKTT